MAATKNNHIDHGLYFHKDLIDSRTQKKTGKKARENIHLVAKVERIHELRATVKSQDNFTPASEMNMTKTPMNMTMTRKQ